MTMSCQAFTVKFITIRDDEQAIPSDISSSQSQET